MNHSANLCSQITVVEDLQVMKTSAGEFGDSALEQKWMILKIWSEPWPKPHYPTGPYLLFWSIILTLVFCSPPPPPPGDWGQPEQHAVPGRVRSLLWALVPGVGDGPPDAADASSREVPHAPLAAHGLRVPIRAGHTPTAQQESRLIVYNRCTQTSPFILNACSLHGDVFLLLFCFKSSF